jgi:hypothetical protein
MEIIKKEGKFEKIHIKVISRNTVRIISVLMSEIHHAEFLIEEYASEFVSKRLHEHIALVHWTQFPCTI